jgi:hypothetical protein
MEEDYYSYLLNDPSIKHADKKNILNLLNQIIEKAKTEDEEHKKRALSAHRGSQATGESWMVFHLKVLRELIEKR